MIQLGNGTVDYEFVSNVRVAIHYGSIFQIIKKVKGLKSNKYE